MVSMSIRLILAVICGSIIGIEREFKRRPAGFRTHILICMGAAMTTLISEYLLVEMHYTTDIARLGAQVIAGIGFIGAGTIIVTRHQRVKGLTTAAGLWACAAAGLTLGIGFYEAAVAGSMAIFVILTLLQRMDDRMHRRGRLLDIYFELTKGYPLGDFMRAVRDMDLDISSIRLEADTVLSDGSSAFIATVKAKRRLEHTGLLAQLRTLQGVVYLEEI